MESTELDPVTQRIPIILNKGVNGQLLLFEYKRMQVAVSTDCEQKVIKSRLKPKQQKVEIHLEMNKDSKNFNPELAKNLAPKFNPKAPTEFGSSMIETQILSSATAVHKNQERYAVGILHHNENGQREIHLNPLDGMIYLKQSYAYLDAADKKTDQANKQDASAAIAGQNSAATAKPVSVKFARNDPNRAKKTQSKSLAAQQKLKDEEPWCETTYFSIGSQESKRERERLVSDQQDLNSAAVLVDPPETFLPVLCPSQLPDLLDSNTSVGPLSHDDMSRLSFQDQITERMKQVGVIQFSKLKKYIHPPRSDFEILNALQRTAIPIHGNWVVSSEQLYKENFASSSGVTAERLCRGRDSILYLFTDHEVLTQTQATNYTKLPPVDVNRILKDIAVQEKSVGWRFKMKPDVEFMQQYKEDVDRLFNKFKMKIKNVEKKQEEEAAENKLPTTPSKKGKYTPGRQRKTSKSRKDSYSSDH